MAPRIASPWWLRAEGARLEWQTMFGRRLAQADRLGRVDRELLARQKVAVGERPLDIQLRWMCSDILGVPFGPFTVWMRIGGDKTEQVNTRSRSQGDQVRMSWTAVMAIIDVECTVIDGNRAVAMFASRTGGGVHESVGAAATRGATGARVKLRVRCSGATRLTLVNARDVVVRCQTLDSVINDSAWQRFELVGLPVAERWSGTAYDTSKQGLMSALVDPYSAAMQRLQRGGPPIGWFPLTETGRAAPHWVAPDFKRLLGEVDRDLLPRIARLYRTGLVPPDQGALLDTPPVDPPQSGSRVSSLETKAELPPLALLTLPASTDPFLALATGFGTCYPASLNDDRMPFGRADFLITAEYQDTPLRQGAAEVAAFVPRPGVHGDTPAPTGLTSERGGLVAPLVRDHPWRETIRVSWKRVEASAAMGRPTGASIVRYPASGAAVGECLLPVRDASDFRPMLVVPDGLEGTPGFARTAMVDAAATIPLGSGGRSVGYAVAVEDVFGVWSRWDDVAYAGNEPLPPTPRVVALSLTSAYAGSPSCPATLEVELSVDWANRTPSRVELASVFYPMANAVTPPPGGMAPVGPAPMGGFRRDAVLPFVGNALTAPAGATVDHLDSAGELIVTPGPLQGDDARRYRVRLPVPALDFASTPRWGVQLWVRNRLVVVGAPTAWSPDPAHPALANAASPVPVAPLPPPQPPGVPIGSTPDAQGRSHVRVRWSLPAGADVQKVVVWEVAESALRQTAGLSQRDADGTLPGWRLQHLRDAYDGLPALRRRAAFRRLLELPGTARDADVALPKGSTDIHLFAVTTVTSSGVESPWPGGPVPHQQLQAVAAPRIRRPAAPRVRAIVETDGSVTVRIEAPSRVPVHAFQLYRTRSGAASRSHETMGPAFASVPAVPPLPGASPDPVTGEQSWTGIWHGTFDPSWDDWFVRAIAVPVDGVPEEAVRGAPSVASEVITFTVLPTGAPDLAPLVAKDAGTSAQWVLVRTSTSAPMRAVALGSHRISGQAGGELLPAALETIDDGPLVAAAGPGTGVAGTPHLVHGPRESGRTPLGIWIRRVVPSDPIDVVLRLVDPLGRLTEQRLTVPPYVPPEPSPPRFELVDVMSIAGRGVVVTVRTDAPIRSTPPYVFDVAAARGRTSSPFDIRRPPTRPVTASFPLNAIPVGSVPAGGTQVIQMVRSEGLRRPTEFQCLVRLLAPLTVTITLVSPNGMRQQVVANTR
jgi:hypothetical protein